LKAYPASSPHRIKIRNVITNMVGRTRTERFVTHETWQKEVLPVLDSLLRGPETKIHKALIGRWVVEYIGNDPHMYEFFVKNWKQAFPKSEAQIKSYVVTRIRNREAMKSLLGLHTEEDLKVRLESLLEAIRDKKYRSTLRDETLRDIEKYPLNEQIDIALFAPATVYSAHDRSFVSLNTNYYGQLKSKSTLGPLEEYLTRQAKVNHQGRITNPEKVWLSMHAGCVEYVPHRGRRRGIVIIAPTGTGKSTHGYGLVDAKKENRLHSDDWVFVNLATREVLISENQFYMRTNIAGIYAHLIPLLVCQPLENVSLTDDMVQLLEQFESAEELRKAIEDGRIPSDVYEKLREQMIQTNAARSLIDPRLMVGRKKFIEKTKLTDLFLFKRDYDSSMVLQILSEDEMIDVLTSSGNVFNYDYGKSDPDGYGIPLMRTTEVYYNPYLCTVEMDREKGIIGKLDQVRVEAYRALFRHKGMTVSWLNTRLPAPQTQFCIRKFLEGGIDSIRLEKGRGIEDALLKILGLVRKDKPAIPGRRPEDLIGFFDDRGREVEIVGFYAQGKLLEAVAFLKSGKEGPQLVSYSAGSPEEFFSRHEPIAARKLLGG
jgi:hypothetical protein